MEHDIFEIMYSLRAMRRLKPDPVPEALIWKVVEAGTQAPSGGNSQPWRFVVVQDPQLKRFIQERYRAALSLYLRAGADAATCRANAAAARDQATADTAKSAAATSSGAAPSPAAARRARVAVAANHLADHLHEAPILLFVCLMPRDLPLLGDRPHRGPAIYASIFPAVQNVLLACRALGLGATLTTLHLLHEDEIKERLGIPTEVETVALLPIGYPVGRFGPTTRKPPEEVTYWDGWNQLRARR
jgi:nitroreductase